MDRAESIDAGKDWHGCINWLKRCGVLQSDHTVNKPQASAFDLAYMLQDGVLLCNLLDTVHPGSINMEYVNQKPQLVQFLCLRNIKVFLSVCSSVFGLAESELFEPFMLFDLSNFQRVLCTLSALSNSPRFRRNSVCGFSIGHGKPQDSVYKNLQSIYCEEEYHRQRIRLLDYDDADWKKRNYSYENSSHSPFYSYPYSMAIYENLCGTQSDLSPPPSATQDSRAARDKKSDYVIRELIETEQNYTKVLSNLLKYFALPLSSLLRQECYSRIFFGLKTLSEFHMNLHSELCKARNGVALAQIFLNSKEKFLIYGDYCANLLLAQNTLQEVCARNELINQEIIRCEKEANNGAVKLSDILTVPMQRMLKYQLILDKLVKETPPEWVEDYRALTKAREMMVDVTQYIHEAKRDSETLDIIKDIQASIVAWNMPKDAQFKNIGRLLHDGELKVKAQGDLRIKVRYVFIFEQMMLICKSDKADQYRYRETLWLEDYRLEHHTNRRLSKGSRWSTPSYEWLLVHKQTFATYTLYVRTEEQRQLWMKMLQDAMDNVKPMACHNTNHKLKLMTFDTPQICPRCDKFLKGLILQGYKCEMCHLVVHKHCIADAGHCIAMPLSPISPTLSSPSMSSPTLPPRPRTFKHFPI